MSRLNCVVNDFKLSSFKYRTMLDIDNKLKPKDFYKFRQNSENDNLLRSISEQISSKVFLKFNFDKYLK